MNNKNAHMPFLLAAKIIDLLYINGATYQECDDILEMVLSEIHESKSSLEYQTCDNYVNRNKVCNADNMPMHFRMNTPYIQRMVDEDRSFLYDTDLYVEPKNK